MSKSILWLMLLFGFVPLFSHAACNRNNGDNVSVSTIPLPSQILVNSKNYSQGEVLYDSGYIAGSNSEVTIKNCSNNYYVGFHYNMGSLASAAPIGENIYPTNIPGIGIRTYTLNQAGPYDEERAIDNSWQSGNGDNNHTLRDSSYRVQLIATGGPISSGSLALSGNLATVDFREGQSTSDNGDNASEVVLSTTMVNVYAMGCTADVNSINFVMGSIDISQFNQNNRVLGPEQDINLSCQPGTNVTMTINGAVATGDNDNGSVIALSASDSGEAATGLGVQIMTFDPTQQAFNSSPLGQSVVLFSSQRSKASNWSSGQAADGSAITDRGSASTYSDAENPGGTSSDETLRFRADYYKTGQNVTPGVANSTGTITLQYN